MRANFEILTSEKSGLAECLDRLSAQRRETRPLSTYRLQFHKGFRFTDAIQILPYLHSLGISHVYSSPILKARTGSTHGYDITDHNILNPEIGTEEELLAFVAELRRLGMGQILDTVPNHMGIGFGENPWWRDVLENGEASEYAEYFDIDWDPLKPELRHKLLLPILGNQYGEELEEGRIRIEYAPLDDSGPPRFNIRYYDKVLPIDPQSIPLIFEPVLQNSASRLDSAPNRDASRLKNLLEDLRKLPPHSQADHESLRKRREFASRLLNQLAELIEGSADNRALVDEAVRMINGQPGRSESFDALHNLLEAQVYRLAHWRVSAEEINYRRFFDINELVGLRMENPKVFAATHRLLRRLLSNGSINGIRIDHCDGLLNPRQYFIRLQMLYAASQCSGAEPVPPLSENGIESEIQRIFGQHDWISERAPLYTVVEKILEPGEQLPVEWPVDGTSGYDFTNLVNGIFIQQLNERAFTNIYRRFIGGLPDFDLLLYSSKKLIMNTALSSEVNVLAHMLDEISSSNRYARDFTRKALRDAIRETIACFLVYRSYIDERGEVSERDRHYINEAIARAKRLNAGTAAAVFDFLRDILLLASSKSGAEQNPDGNGASSYTDHGSQWDRNGDNYDLYYRKLQFTLKFQQLTGPVMAKSMEDTVCYVYNRFISVNEVGSTPKLFGHSVDEFHRGNLIRADHWPYSMLATSSHDTKRSEDVRARLNVLTEMPRQWSSNVMRWRRANRTRKRVLPDGRTAPDLNEEYFLYQTLVGAWPLAINSEQERQNFVERIQQYMVKALHEAKVNLSWINPDPDYVAATAEFISRILAPATRGKSNSFLESIHGFLPTVQYFGLLNSLSQVLLKVASPGLPDLYQGTERWDFSLVDPDNRGPVNFNDSQWALEALEAEASTSSDLLALCARLLANMNDGRIKLWATARALQFRRDNPELFRETAYYPVEALGSKQEHVCAFARGVPPHKSDHSDKQTMIVAVPRFSYTLMRGRIEPPLGEVWSDTELVVPANAPNYFENVLTGEMVKLTNKRTLLCREVFANFPVALLVGR